MKKRIIPKLTAGVTAGVLIGASMLPGCGNVVKEPETQEPSVVTETPTPTPKVTPKSTRVTAPTVSPTPEVTDVPDFSPQANVEETVYGPPEDYVYTEPVNPEYDPEANVLEDVYGPPSDFIEEQDEDSYIRGYFDENGHYIEYEDGYYYFDPESETWIWVETAAAESPTAEYAGEEYSSEEYFGEEGVSEEYYAEDDYAEEDYAEEDYYEYDDSYE